MFSRVFGIDALNGKGESSQEVIAQTVQEYAKIQYAVIAGEKADYKEALRVLSSLQTHGHESHISRMAESVTNSIQTLKREVPKNDNEER
jgi:predicted chitinase